MVTMFVGAVVLMFDGIVVLFPQKENLLGGRFLFPPEPLWVKLLNRQKAHF
jgi:hypothetical protein